MAARELGDLVLCTGDLHVPSRAERSPPEFKAWFQSGKMQHVLCTGNVGSRDEMDLLKEAAPNFASARGDFDDTSIPETAVISVRGLRIGVIHGHQVVPWGDADALDIVRRRLGADILVSGHTHELGITEFEGHYFVNPGSLTGAASATAASTTPSFVVLSVTSSKVTAYTYKLQDGVVTPSQVEFPRPGASLSTPPTSTPTPTPTSLPASTAPPTAPADSPFGDTAPDDDIFGDGDL